MVNADETLEKKVAGMVARLSLSEKIGQMTQINIDALGVGENVYSSYAPFRLDYDMVEHFITKYKIGSVFNSPSTTAMRLEEWHELISVLQKKSIASSGIPLIYGIDSIHGATYIVGSTLFPQPIAMAAAFNMETAYKCAVICGYETRASGISWNFAPILDLGRDPRWSRQWETFGEDCYLVSEMGLQYLKGMQGENRSNIGSKNIAACLKHYLGYGVPFSGRDRTPACIPEHELREKHFLPYLRGIEAGALSVMPNSGQVNGTPVHCNHKLLTVWLKEELAWDGVIVSDWADVDNLWKRDKVAKDRKEAIKLAVNAGIDMAMVPHDTLFCDLLCELVSEGEVRPERIDDAVSRILKMKFRMNLFDRPFIRKEDFPDFGSRRHTEISRDAAAEAITLLKNEGGILPLPEGCRILVCGSNADSMNCLNGGWSYSWQGHMADEFLPEGRTIVKALKDRFGSDNVLFEPGVGYRRGKFYHEEDDSGIPAAVSAAKDADYIILCLGENSYCETPGNLDDLYISDVQAELALRLADTGKPVVLILNEGRPRIISRFAERMEAVLQIYLPGSMGAVALAGILAGDINPSGKLPYTYPKYPNNLSTYDHKPSESIDVIPGAYNYNARLANQWEFGYGMCYTVFEYSGLKIDRTGFDPGDILHVEVAVRNAGCRSGKEVVLLYISDDVASLTPDIKRLRRFEKISLDAEEEKRVRFDIPAYELAYVGPDGLWRIEEGTFTVRTGGLTEIIYCQQNYTWLHYPLK